MTLDTLLVQPDLQVNGSMRISPGGNIYLDMSSLLRMMHILSITLCRNCIFHLGRLIL